MLSAAQCGVPPAPASKQRSTRFHRWRAVAPCLGSRLCGSDAVEGSTSEWRTAKNRLHHPPLIAPHPVVSAQAGIQNVPQRGVVTQQTAVNNISLSTIFHCWHAVAPCLGPRLRGGRRGGEPHTRVAYSDGADCIIQLPVGGIRCPSRFTLPCLRAICRAPPRRFRADGNPGGGHLCCR